MISYFYLEKDLSGMDAQTAALVVAFVKFVLSAEGQDVRALAGAAGADPADCWPILCHLAANGRAARVGGNDPAEARFRGA